MTQPGAPIYPQPGWWVRSGRVGVNFDLGFGWAGSAVGELVASGHVSPGYGWSGSAHGISPIPILTPFTTAGSYTYTIPSGYTHVDVILLGAGGGGGCGNAGGGASSGQAGSWSTTTLVIGTSIAAGATITGSVGAAGAGATSPGSGAPGGTGGNTTATASGWSGLTANGGLGGQSWPYTSGYTGGVTSPGNKTFGANPNPYVGGAAATGSVAGHAPGGAGGVANVNQNPGNVGAPGAAWFYVYS